MKKPQVPRRTTDRDRAIGERIRRFRLEAGRTIESVAEAIGVTHQQVQKYESGSNRIAASRLQDVAETLGKDIALFFRE